MSKTKRSRWLPGMGNPEKNIGLRRRKIARSLFDIHATEELALRTLPSGKNDLGKVQSKHAKAHPPIPGIVWQDARGRVYRNGRDGSARRVNG